MVKTPLLLSRSIFTRLKNAQVKRFFSGKPIRVRFAPSPTGLLHLGGLRTALYNHLFAKSQNGVTIIRIEDTDLERKIESAAETLIDDLKWCGIEYDEGPYYQSERVDLYRKYVDQLLNEGKAYYCFCSKTRLNLLRKEAMKTGAVPSYDNCCRALTKEEVNEKLSRGETPCVRFKLSSVPDSIPDLIYGSCTHKTSENEGDFVILKADGFPTYHFANVVDDHLMNISHVLRGVEWQISTVKHILLYRAFNWEPPVYGHIPLLLNPDGTKLSKRQGDVDIQSLRRKGYFPQAVVNFVIRFGGGFKLDMEEKDSNIYTMDELRQHFDLSRIRANSSKISLHHLDDYNRMEIGRLLSRKEDAEDVVKRLQEMVTKQIADRGAKTTASVDEDSIRLILDRLKSRITKLEDLLSDDFNYLWVWDNKTILDDESDVATFERFLSDLDSVDWHLDPLKKFTKEFAERNNLKFGKVMKLLRAILVERKDGPSIPELMEVLGKDTVRFRILKMLEKSKRKV